MTNGINISENKYYQSWQSPSHAVHFDCWAELTDYELKKTYERFNEFVLLKQYASSIRGNEFVEVGCATGELYRFIKANYPRFQYNGFDISKSALGRAKTKYPKGNFSLSESNASIVGKFPKKPALVFSRDVILHQTDPYGFLRELLEIPGEALLLRLRTRDKGATVLDPGISCQWHYNEWVPYIILNTDELIEKISKSINFDVLHVVKNFMPLGGYNGRFLPKECYYPETGTAETAVFIKFADQKPGRSEVIIEEKKENPSGYNGLEYFFKLLRKIRKKGQ